MAHYTNKELDKRINAFLTKKMQKFPELDVLHRDSKYLSMPTLSHRMLTTTR